MTNLLNELARATFDTRWENDRLAKRLIFGRPDITFDEVKAGIADGTIVPHALEHEYQHARAIVAAIEAGGCRIVPVEMTAEMHEAALDMPACGVDVRAEWAAVLAAAPKVLP